MNIRSARVTDIPAIQALIAIFAERKLMILRSDEELYQTIRELAVAEEEGRIIGCAALHVFDADLAEVRSVAVEPRVHRKGVGRLVVSRCCEDAQALGITRVFTLTTAVEFFEKCGFGPIDKSELPHAIWGECVRCPCFPSCPETALVWLPAGARTTA